MQHTNCVLYVLITHCHNTLLLLLICKKSFLYYRKLCNTARVAMSVWNATVYYSTLRNRNIFVIFCLDSDSVSQTHLHAIRLTICAPFFLQRRCSLSIPLACIADCIFPPAYCCSFHNWKSLTVRKRQKEGRHYHTAQNKSLICHTAFLCKPDLYAQLRCFVWLDVHVLSAGGFQKQGPLGYVYLLCCQLVRADTD